VPQKQSYAERYIAEFLPPPEPEPKPQPKEVPRETQQVQTASSSQPLEARRDVPQAEQVPGARTSAAAGGAAAVSEAIIEGLLNRKHEWESRVKKASNRSWEKVYVMLSNGSLLFYKDQKHAKSEPSVYFRHEQPLDVNGAVASAATDYTKRPHVFRVKLTAGSEFLFQCKNDEEMGAWIREVNSASGLDEQSAASKSMTMPPSLEGKRDEPKRRSFLTLGRKSKERE